MNVRRSRQVACLSAAVAAMLYGSHHVRAADLVWDANATADPLGLDGSGTWITPSADPAPDAEKTWVSGGVNVAWTNGDNATFGNNTSALVPGVVHNIEIGSPITVNDLSVGIGTDGGIYNFTSFTDGAGLTIAGNVTKIAGGGQPQFLLFSAPITLTAGDHVFALRDTSGPVSEMLINGPIAGDGGVRLDHTAVTTEAWGTLAFNADNTYTGHTNIDKGRLVITTAGGLGSTAEGTTISNQGTLSIGGAGTTVPSGGINITEPITITRSVYSGGEFGRYGAALVFANGSGNHTVTTPIVIDSADGRIGVETSTLTLPGGKVVFGPNGTAANGVVSFTGDYAGFVVLEGANPEWAARGIKLVNAVEVQATSHDELGGETAPITFSGDATLGIMNGFMTEFGSHPVNYDSFSGGLNIPEGQVFTLTQPITGGAGMGKRGTGTLNFNATVTRTAGVGDGGIWWDGGIVNINANHTVGAIHLRDPIVNIADGVTLTTNGGYSSVGQDGGDSAVVNILGSAALIGSGADFNVADNADSAGVVNLSATGTFSVGGLLAVAKNTNATGTFNNAGGTVSVGGELWVGQGGGTGTFNHEGGTISVGNWVAIGRNGGNGTFNLTGGTFNKQGGGQFIVADNATGKVTMSGATTALNINNELWVGQGGPGNGTLDFQDGTISIGSWVAIGRDGGKGTFNQSGGTVTKNLSGDSTFIIGAGGGSIGTYNLSGGTMNTTARTWISEGGGGAATGVWNVNGGTANIAALDVGRNGSGSATLNISNNGAVNAGVVRFGEAGSVSGTINLDGGGTLAATQIIDGNSSGTGTVNFNGGTLKAAGGHDQFMQGITAANVKDGGAVIDSNGFNVTVAQPLVANGTGGLTKNGAGTLRLGGVNTYTGATVANAGNLVLGKSLTTSSSVSAQNDATIELANDGTHNQFINTPSVTIAAGASIDLRDNKLLTNTPVGSFNGTAYTGIQGEVQRAYNFGAWDQPGLKTSMPEAGPNAGLLSGTTTLATATAEQVMFIGATDTGVFQGQTVTGATTIAMYTYAGDLNMDGLVDGADYGVIDNSAQFPGTTGYANGDFNYDGVIDGADYGIIDNTIQLQGAPFPGVVFGAASSSASSGGGLSGVTAVPEPSACGFAMFAAAALLGRRRRRHHRQ